MSREPDPLTALPEVVHAHRQRLLLERRLGAGGRAVFADAYAITSCWWNIPALNAPVWQARSVRWAAPDATTCASRRWCSTGCGIGSATQ